MDQFIKYSLPIDKSNIDWELESMRHGGSQLIEILEKEFQYEKLLISGDRMGINPSQLRRLKDWIEAFCDLNVMVEESKFNEQFAKSFFYRGAGMLAILYKSLDLSPVIQDNHFLSRFSFIRYNIIKNELGSLVISEIENKKWSNHEPSDYEKSFMTQHFFYDSDFNRLQSDDKLSREILDMYNIMQIMTEVN